jgi:hypothetical protein
MLAENKVSGHSRALSDLAFDLSPGLGPGNASGAPRLELRESFHLTSDLSPALRKRQGDGNF